MIPAAIALLALGALPSSARGADLEAARGRFHRGEYDACRQMAEEAISAGSWNEAWWHLRIRSALAIGEYRQALDILPTALRRHPSSIRLRLLGCDVYRKNGHPQQSDAMLAEIEQMAAAAAWRYSDAVNRVTLGRAFLRKGADARQVLEFFFDRAKKDRPELADAHLATGDLALAKHDYGLAAEAFEEAQKRAPDDPAASYGLARAYAASDSERSTAALISALKKNPRHVPSLLLQVDQLIDGERYAQAEELIGQVLAINPWEEEAWAQRAVLAHLDGDPRGEALFRDCGLRWWDENPRVDHLIGRKLSQKYRFAEGSAYQRRALRFDPDYQPARTQLCQDLLRLGEEEEGWRLAREVYDTDGYNVVAYNLVTLHDALDEFCTLQTGDFTLRMDAREAQIYGPRVMRLLVRAKRTLCEKYHVQIDDPVVVEIFPQQKDFAVRTFGIPGGAGYLGVCFGRVITANSPASQGEHPSNWEAVLWHEFCHVVTLTKTRNKMPRWLSEGISVYEEKQADPAWGQTMNPRYRQMVLGGELTPVSNLSAAFLKPKSGLHLQFAYYESSLVVEYLIGRHGPRALERILTDLADDVPINQALSRHTGSLTQFEAEFAQYARRLARRLAPDADFSPPELPPEADADALATWTAEHPHNVPGLLAYGKQLLTEGRWEAARTPLEKLVELYPGHTGPDSAYLHLARAHRELGDAAAETAALERLAILDSDAAGALLRLTELAAARGDLASARRYAERALAVNPLRRAPHEQLARAAEQLGDLPTAADAYRTLLAMDPPDPAGTHFDLARLLYEQGALPQAKRHVLQALEEAPRYRAAHRLLLEIIEEAPPERPAAVIARLPEQHAPATAIEPPVAAPAPLPRRSQ